VQLGVVKSGNLTMHMLVLFASTGASIDLHSQGYIIDRMRCMFPKSVYTPCIEEHNIHAIFRWDFDNEYCKNEKDGINCISNNSEESVQGPNKLLFRFPQISLPVGPREDKFLNNTGLTMSITTLGTYIYRVGTKRVKLENVYANDDTRACLKDDQAAEDFVLSEYSDLTEQFIFDMCKYIHLVLIS